MRNVQNSDFVYSVVIKNDQAVTYDALEVFPSLDELTLHSRKFQSYADTLSSCRRLLEDITANINHHVGAQTFRLAAEVNPEISGQDTLSTDWGEDEVSRVWVFDRGMEGQNQKIEAICRGSIFAVEADRPAAT